MRHCLQARYEVRAAGRWLQQLVSSIPYVEWFARAPDEAPDSLAPSTPPKPPSLWGL